MQTNLAEAEGLTPPSPWEFIVPQPCGVQLVKLNSFLGPYSSHSLATEIVSFLPMFVTGTLNGRMTIQSALTARCLPCAPLQRENAAGL